MWKLLLVALLPLLARTDSFVVVPEDEIIKTFSRARALLTPEQEEFLTEILAADDALIELKSRGIVDDILQTLSGSGSNIRVNLVGGSNPPAPASPSGNNQQQPAVNIINPTFTLVGSSMNQEKALLNGSSTAANNNAIITTNAVTSAVSSLADSSIQFLQSSNASSSGAPIQIAGGNAAPQNQNGNVTTIGGNNNHLFSTITQVIRNSNTRNVTGIVDESLRIATPAPIREFVTGILNVVYCNGIRRLLGRC